MCKITSEDSKNFHDNISKNVRKLRLEKSLTQLDISLLMGFNNNPSFITNAESIKL
jgi:transcriptional regulator with XRE-family HTH domain